MTSFLNLSPEEQQRQVQAALLEDAQDRKEQRERAARIVHDRGEVATPGFIAATMGRQPQPGAAVDGAIQAMRDQDVTAEQTRLRMHNIVDAWYWNQDGTIEQLKRLLGTRQAAVCAQMATSQTELRRRAEQAEQRKAEWQREAEALRRENATLRYRADRLEAMLGALEVDAADASTGPRYR